MAKKKNSFVDRIKKYKDTPFIISVLIMALGAGIWLLAPGYFNMHDDLQMLRQRAMEECFRDLQIPCRWTPHMGYGFGFPLFNYYPPLPYLYGEIFRVLGLSFITTVKLTFLSSFILSGVFMYILAKDLWGRWGGLISAAFYIWAPYHSVDVYVRGAMNESWALIWFPLILWSSLKLIKLAQFRYIVILALSWFALFTSHNLMVLIFAPLFAIWCVFWLIKEKSFFTVPQLLIAGVWSFGLAAFFTLPVILEQKYVHVETLVVGYYEYIVHFADLNQLLISRFWGYGASVWMEDDNMSFQVGHTHWILSLVIVILAIFRIIKTRKITETLVISLMIFASGWAAVFMAHSRSTPIWDQFDRFFKFVQFPWRFLTLVILNFSILAGAIVIFTKKEDSKKWISFVLICIVILLNFNFFKPEKMGPLTDEQKFSGQAWDLQQTSGIYDYLPIGAKTAPKEAQKSLAEIVVGNGEITSEIQKTNSASFNTRIETENSIVRINIFEYPGWKVFVNGDNVETFIGEDEWGRMHINLPKGEHQVMVKLINTFPRSVGNTISIISWIALLTLPLWRKRIN